MSPSARFAERELVVYRSHGLIGGDVAAPAVQLRLRRIRRLRRDLGLSYDVIAIVLPLVERIEELERRHGVWRGNEEDDRAT